MRNAILKTLMAVTFVVAFLTSAQADTPDLA